MWKIPIEREKVLNLLKKIYSLSSAPLDLVVKEIQSFLKAISHSLVAVRSSSTLEDLKKMAGAGLFDSILNVRLDDS